MPRQHWVTVAGAPVLVDDDPEGRDISGVPQLRPDHEAVHHDARRAAGYSTWIRIDGHRVVLSNLDGLTDGTVPGTVHYRCATPADVCGGRLMSGRSASSAPARRPMPSDTRPAHRATGALAMVDGDEAIRQALILLLSTTPGERLMRPEYGSHLHRLVFAPNDDTTAGLAIHYVRQALPRWEPRVDVLHLDAGPDPERPEWLVIDLRYRVRASLVRGSTLHLSIPVGGAS